jgi:hypothetical protein
VGDGVGDFLTIGILANTTLWFIVQGQPPDKQSELKSIIVKLHTLPSFCPSFAGLSGESILLQGGFAG